MLRVFARLFGLGGAVVEDADLDGDVIVGIRRPLVLTPGHAAHTRSDLRAHAPLAAASCPVPGGGERRPGQSGSSPHGYGTSADSDHSPPHSHPV